MGEDNLDYFYPIKISKEVHKEMAILIVITVPIITRHPANNQKTNNKYFDKLQPIQKHAIEVYLQEWKNSCSRPLGERSMLKSSDDILAKPCVHASTRVRSTGTSGRGVYE